MKLLPSHHKLLLCVASCLLISSASHASILFTITELANGKTKWQMTTTETSYVVDQSGPTGNYFEEIVLPKSAFDFDYSAGFEIGFSAPIGRIRNMTTGATIDLTGIRYSSIEGLHFDGGLMSHEVGNSFEIVDLPAINVDVLFSDILVTGSTAYGVTNGPWKHVGQVEITAVPIPEPVVPLLAFLGCMLSGCRRRRMSTY